VASGAAGTTAPNGSAGVPPQQTGTTVTRGGATAPAGPTGQAAGAGLVAQQSGNPSVHAAQTEFQGAGSYRVINGVRVFFPANGGVPVADLYRGADDAVGITSKQIEICAHAALTYGSAFHISASDLNVFWEANAARGGIFGRSVHGDYTNDNYDPGTAVQAAQQCKDKNTFILLGGIGFDQIPAVRQWAEQNHELYLHHIATIEGSAGLRYSFSALPTVEQTGTYLGEVAARQFPHKNIAIIYRQSSNWTPALAPFKRLVTAAGSKIVGEYGVQINQGNYTQELAEARSAGAQVVLSWENALSEIEMIKQAQSQNWHPAWLVNGFNIITNTLGSSSLDQDMWSAAEWDAYDPNYYGGGFASYVSEIKEFEAEYKRYDPNADLSGDGGDLLFLNWEAQKWLADLLTTCGKDCTRNKIAGLLLAGYHKVTPPNCPASFEHTADHHHAGYLFNVLHDVKDPNGRPNFVPVARCVASY
jgi:ABC-type branched-subunit amino acid transport system substrate-binding protein